MTTPRRALAWTATFVLTFVAWFENLGFGLTGLDIWPILAEAQATLDAPLRPWRVAYLEPFWDGGRFWRPLTSSFYALEHAVFGTNPSGFHAVRLLLAALTGCAVGTAAARGRPHPLLAFGLAAAVYVVHPIQAESLPVNARDADTLVALAIVLALVGVSAHSSRPMWLGVFACVAAPFLKETGLIAAPLAVFVLLSRRAPLRYVSAVGAGIAVHVIARYAVLGGLGGYDPAQQPPSPVATIPGLIEGLFDHQQWNLGFAVLGLWLLAAAASLLGRSRTSTRPLDPIAWACVGWIVAQVALVAASPFRMRYAEGLLAPVAILVGHVLAGWWAQAGAGPRSWIRPTLAGSALLLMLLPGSPLLFSYDTWSVSSRISGELTAAAQQLGLDLDAAGADTAKRSRQIGRFLIVAEKAHDERRMSIDPFPFRYAPQPGPWQGYVVRAYIVSPYSLKSALTVAGVDRAQEYRIAAPRPALDVRPGDLSLR